jgi:histidine triad (HIT) family protein
VQRLAGAVAKALNADGLTIMQFNGAAGGQTVFHLHFHIIPRVEGARMAGHGEAKKADMDELQALAAQIAAAL